MTIKHYQLILLIFHLLGSNLLISQSSICHDSHQLTELESRSFSTLQQVSSSNLPTCDLTYLRAKWFLDPNQYYISGNVTYYFHRNVSYPDSLFLDLKQSLVIDTIIQNGQVLNFTHLNNLIRIHLLNPISATSTLDSLQISYHGSPESTGFGSFSTGLSPNALPFLWTLSEPFGASDWYPTRLALGDKLDSLDLFIHTPINMLASGNGLLVSMTSDKSGITHHWKHRHPIAPYLIGIGVGPYSSFTDLVPLRNGILPVVNYVYPERLDEWQSAFPYESRMLQFFDSLLIPYPFSDEKYGHVQFGWGGGMEHQTMSSMADPGEGLMAHELAHQWFGNHVTCGSWGDIWLNEGFATYFAGINTERFFPSEFRNWKENQLNSILQEAGGSVFVYDSTNINQIFNGRLSYAKGAMVLHMLRKKIGDQVFFSALRAYLSNAQLAGKFVRTIDLIQAFEFESGLDLTSFFEKWIYQEGFPDISITQTRYPDGIVKLNLVQTASMPESGPFPVELPILLKWPQGDSLITLDFNSINHTEWLQLPIDDSDALQVIPDFEKDIIARYSTDKQDLAFENQTPIIFPNPASDNFYLFVSLSKGVPKEIQLYNSIGQEISMEIPKITTNGSVLLSPTIKLSSGVYYLRFVIDSNYQTEKLIIEKQ
jgi:aminopeptidase N